MMFHQILNGVFMVVTFGGKMCADTILTETERMEEKRQRNMLFQSVYCLMYGWMKNIKNVPNAKRHVRRRKMDRMTHERVNGIRAGYWSPEKKEELVQRLAAYENTGLEPEEVSAKIEACNIYKSLGLTPDQIQWLKLREDNDGWIPVEKFGLPHSNEHDFRFWVTIQYTNGFRHTIKAKWDCFDKCFIHQNGKKILQDVIAYKYYSAPEPYRPERSEE